MLITKMRNSIDRDLTNDPDCIKGRKKTVQVSFNTFSLFLYHILLSFIFIHTHIYIYERWWCGWYETWERQRGVEQISAGTKNKYQNVYGCNNR